MNYNIPSCFNCLNGICSKGYPDTHDEPGEPPMVEDCKKMFGILTDEKLEVLDYNEEKLAELCDCYNPRLVEKCGNCQKEINQPEYIHEHWASGIWDVIPCCDQKCVDEMETKIDKEIIEFAFHERFEEVE